MNVINITGTISKEANIAGSMGAKAVAGVMSGQNVYVGLISAVVTYPLNNQLVLTFDANLDASVVPALASFGITGKIITGIIILGNTVMLTTSTDFAWDDVVTITYTYDALNPLQNSPSIVVLSFSSGITIEIYPFVMQITLAAAGSITIPHSSGYLYNYTIDWGDASPILTVTAYNHANCTHSYAGAGTYNIIILGTCETIYINNAGTLRTALRKILCWGSEQNYKVLNFYGSSVNEIVSDTYGAFSSLFGVGIEYMFRACISLTSIPSGLFNYATNITSAQFIFYGCTSVTAIPDGLFDYCNAVNNYNSSFYGCTNLVSIPPDLFKDKTSITNLGSVFYGCTSLTAIPSGLFTGLTAISTTAFSSTFSSCTSLVEIPIGLFSTNTAITTSAFNFTFNGCTALTTIPATLFSSCTLISSASFNSAFTGCTALTTLPVDMFRYNVSAASFTTVFKNCSALTTVPTDFFKYNTAALNFTDCFANCIMMQQNRNIFYSDGQKATRFAGKAMTFTRCFDRASFTGVQGEAPDLWSCTMTSSVKTDCWNGAGNSLTSLSNYASIPVAWI